MPKISAQINFSRIFFSAGIYTPEQKKDREHQFEPHFRKLGIFCRVHLALIAPQVVLNGARLLETAEKEALKFYFQ